MWRGSLINMPIEAVNNTRAGDGSGEDREMSTRWRRPLICDSNDSKDKLKLTGQAVKRII